MIFCGLLGALSAPGPNGLFAHATLRSLGHIPSENPQSSPLSGSSSAQAPQEQPTPGYPQTADGFSAQISAVVEAYQKGDATEGRRLLEQFRLPRSAERFGGQIRPELNEILAKRYDRLFKNYVNQTENRLQDLARTKARKLTTDLEPGPPDPPSADKISGPDSMKPSGIVTVKQPVCFNAFFSSSLTTTSQTVFPGEYKAISWEDTYIYQDGAFRFAGRGAWPFWQWEDEESFDKTSPEEKYVPTPLDFAAQTVDEVIPFEISKVVPALKPAMESQNCNVMEATVSRIECKRPRVSATFKHPGSGGESVTAILEAKGDQTRVHISTGKGYYGRLVKQNWSVPIYQKMIESLQNAQPKATKFPSRALASSDVTAGVVQDKTPINFKNWGYHPAPGAHMVLKEAERKQGKHGTAIIYHVESSGFPAGETYSLWMMQSGDHKTRPVLTGYLANGTGTLVCPGQSQPGDPP